MSLLREWFKVFLALATVLFLVMQYARLEVEIRKGRLTCAEAMIAGGVSDANKKKAAEVCAELFPSLLRLIH